MFVKLSRLLVLIACEDIPADHPLRTLQALNER